MPALTTAAREIGRYTVLEKIADGGMGTVYKARPTAGGGVVAVKVIAPETARNALLLRRFEQEFKAAHLIDHPNVVKAIEFNTGGASPFLVMEYVDGGALGERVERDGPLSEELAVHVVSQVCEGLQSAHKQGLIHRDVKPDNILVTADWTAKITDLGLVKELDADVGLTRTGKGLGTPHYMAPEQFRNAKHADVRCDVYSLAATLYTLVSGKVPFAPTSPLDCWMRKVKDDLPDVRAVAPGVSERLNFAVRRAMRANPAERPANCREFMEDLTGLNWKGGSGGQSSANLAPVAAADDLWYLVYYDGPHQRTGKATTESVRRSLRAAALGDPARALVSRSKDGPFVRLHSAAEFRDLILDDRVNTPLPVALADLPTPAEPPTPPTDPLMVVPVAAASSPELSDRPRAGEPQPTVPLMDLPFPAAAAPADEPPALKPLPWWVPLSAAAGLLAAGAAVAWAFLH